MSPVDQAGKGSTRGGRQFPHRCADRYQRQRRLDVRAAVRRRSGLLLPAHGASHDGRFDIELEQCTAIRQHYLKNTAILRTEMEDARGGRIEVIDFSPRFYQHGRIFAPSASSASCASSRAGLVCASASAACGLRERGPP